MILVYLVLDWEILHYLLDIRLFPLIVLHRLVFFFLVQIRHDVIVCEVFFMFIQLATSVSVISLCLGI